VSSYGPNNIRQVREAARAPADLYRPQDQLRLFALLDRLGSDEARRELIKLGVIKRFNT